MELKNYSLIKIVLSGPTNSGKSSILERYICNNFNTEYNYTVGVDFKYKLIKNPNHNIKLHLWDTCGLKHFRDLIKLYYNDANIIIYTFDASDKQSETECIDCINIYEMKPEVNLYLIGNKIDLNEGYELSNELQKLCDERNIKFFKCSAKTGYNIKEIFEEIISNFKIINGINLGTLGPIEYIKSKCVN